jgi:Tol biopolymer transport system component
LETIIIEFSLESKEKETGVAKKISKKEKIVEGGKIIFSFRGEIYSINPDGSEKENLTKTEEYREESPQWSPDGEKIGFMRGSQIGVMKFEPNSKSIYLNFENTIQDPKFSWSPDSKKIFLYSNRESNPLIWDLTSNNLKKFRPWERGSGLYAKKLIWDPKEGLIVMSKSLDGGALVLISESGVGNGIGYKIIKDSNRIKEILDRQSDPQISPSGKKKVFSGKKFKEREIIYLSDIDGKNKKELAHGYSPRWQPISR